MNVIKAAVTCIKYLWAFPVTCIGLAVLPFVLLSGGAVSVFKGVIETEGALASFLLSLLRIDAIAVGHVIFCQNRDSLARCRDHERVHVRQCERWGPLFPVLYLLSSASALVRGLDPYKNNRFEQEAFKKTVNREK